MQQQYAMRRGPNSDDFIPVKGGSDFGGHSRGGSLGGGKDESVFDPEEALLAKVRPDDPPALSGKLIGSKSVPGLLRQQSRCEAALAAGRRHL